MTKLAFIALLLATYAAAAPSRARLPRQDGIVALGAENSTAVDTAGSASAATAGADPTDVSVASGTDSTDISAATDSADGSTATFTPAPADADADPASAASPPASTSSCAAGSVTTSSSMIFAGPGLLSGGPGAIFWQSNDESANVVFSANLDENGTMTFGGAYSTGGRGSHIGPDSTKPNALASQGNVKVVDDKLTVVNSGSDTVSLYQVDFENPALIRMIGNPVSTMGTFPIGSSINTVNHNVCVLNAGATNGVCCYTIDLRRGLIPIPNTVRSLNLTLTTPPASEDGTPSEVFFAPDGTKLFATVKASNNGTTPGFIAAWDIDPTDFSLSENFVMTPASNSASSITPIHFSSAIFTTEIGSGVTVLDISNQTLAQKPPVAETLLAINGSQHNAWSEDSDATGNYYIADSAADMLTEISIDSSALTSQIVKQYPLPTGGSCMDQEVASINGADTLYIMCAGELKMETFSLVAPGNVVPKQSFDLAAAAQLAGVPISSNFVAGANAFFTG